MANSMLSEFCGSTFWNRSLTWDTDDPELTTCFEKTALVWIPCFFLWIFSIFEVCYMKRSKKWDIPWNYLNISKLTINGGLVILTLADMVTSFRSAGSSGSFVNNVDIYSPLIKACSFGLAGVILLYNRKYGLQTSGLLFIFWFLSGLCGASEFRSNIRGGKQEKPIETYYFYTNYIIYPLIIMMVVINCFPDKKPRERKYPASDHPCPEEGASFLSRISFSWFDPLAFKGFKKPLEIKDLWDVNTEDSAKELVPAFEKHWENTLKKYKRYCGRNPKKWNITFFLHKEVTDVICSIAARHHEVKFKSESNHVDFTSRAERKVASVLPAIFKCFGPVYLFGASLKLFNDILLFVNPQVLSLLISHVREGHEAWKGYFYALLLFSVGTIQTLLQAQYFNRMFTIGLRIRTVIISTIYRKALRISNKARKESTVGEIVNLMAVDAKRFMDSPSHMCMVWSAPFQICLSMYFLWKELGPSTLVGLAVMVLLIPLNGFIINKSKTLQIKQMKSKDERVRLMNEILSGIKVLKLYAWEPSFENQVLKIRDKEIKVLKESAYLNAGTAFIWSCAPFMVSLASFGTYVLIDEKNVLDANKAFVSISLFNIIKHPVSMLPAMISNLIQALVSVKRVNKFMNAEELNPENVHHEPSNAVPLIIENGTFSWGDDPILKNINIRLNKNYLTAVVGSVGSGKSSLISAFLGEMDKVNGRVNTYGTIAYVSQQAWIQNATLKDNILFGQPFNKIVYDKIVEACALKPDFDMLPAGDLTEIGEKGINLSGGQKQRVSLARAVYANADIYFLDDPLSAVDSHVGKHIFEHVIGPEGLLNNKTRVLVTHSIIYLSQIDNILVMNSGEISESGTYQDLLDNKGTFAEFLMHHLTEEVETELELEEIQDQLVDTPISEDITRCLSRHPSHVSESISEFESNNIANGSLQSQKSIDRTGKQYNIKNKSKPEPKRGEKLIEIEKAETGNVSWAAYSHYLGSIGLFSILVISFLNGIFQGFSIGSNVWLGIWAEDPKMHQNGTVDSARRDMYLGVYGAFGVAQVVLVLLSSIMLYIGTLNAAKSLHNILLSNIMRVPCATFFDVTPVGRILNRFSRDVDTLDNVLPTTLRGWLINFFLVMGTMCVISSATPIFIAVIIPIGIVYCLVQRYYVATSRQLKRLEAVSRSPIFSHFGETLTGAQTIRAFDRQDRFILDSEKKVDINQVCYYPGIIANRWLAVRLEMMGNLIIFFAALFSVLKRTQAPGLVGLSVSYSMQITATLNWLVRNTTDVETNIVSVERIKEYAEVQQEAAWEIPNKKPANTWPEKGSVEFKNYSVRYRPGLDLVLTDITFYIKGGEKVGIVGRTGAGKSSLTLSLFRIIQAANGQILIDGVNIFQLGLHTLRSRLTIIPQDAVLFFGTLRMNLDPFNQYSDKELWKSLEDAHLKEFIKGLPAGLQHEVTEGGENLSVGQRQLVCLARALLRKTKLLVLDEATAAVDLETDDLIQKTIRKEFKNSTVLTIAHRLNTIMDSDRIIVLDKGQIVEFDSPKNLLANQQSVFYGMSKDAGLA